MLRCRSHFTFLMEAIVYRRTWEYIHTRYVCAWWAYDKGAFKLSQFARNEGLLPRSLLLLLSLSKLDYWNWLQIILLSCVISLKTCKSFCSASSLEQFDTSGIIEKWRFLLDVVVSNKKSISRNPSNSFAGKSSYLICSGLDMSLYVFIYLS